MDIFCKIIKGEIPAEVVWQDEEFLVIKDIHPQAPVHLLIISKRHIENLKDLGSSEDALMGKVFRIAQISAEKSGVGESGYRLIRNEGPDSEFGVPHFHVHLLGGKKLGTKVVQ